MFSFFRGFRTGSCPWVNGDQHAAESDEEKVNREQPAEEQPEQEKTSEEARIQSDVDRWIRMMSDPDYQIRDLMTLTNRILKATTGSFVGRQQMKSLKVALKKIHKLSNFKTTLWESDGKTQRPTESTLSALLLKTLADNFHNVHANCKRLSKKGQCELGNPFIPGTTQHKYRCDYHKESVSVHLVLACLNNAMWAICKGMGDNMVMKAAFLGLYHDIGKPLTVETYDQGNGKTYTGFPAHGEVGYMMFLRQWHPGMGGLISKKEYVAIGTAILRHMCGYHDTNRYKHCLLLLEQPEVRALLEVNRVGDHFGKLGLNETGDEIEEYLDEQEVFEERMDPKHKFNFSQLLKTYGNENGFITSEKICVYLVGTSGAGKSHFVEQMEEKFPADMTVVSRDKCMASVCCGVHQRLVGKDYMKMYDIYEAGKTLSALVRKPKANGKKAENLLMTQLEKARNALADAQKAWNLHRVMSGTTNIFPEIEVHGEQQVPNIMGDVQTLFEKEINDALANPKTFLVIDTFMSCFPNAIENCVPEALKRLFRVHVHIQSYLERTSTSVADTIEKQLKISGSYGIDNPMHPDGFKTSQNKKSFTSLSAEHGSGDQLPRPAFESRFRPHLVAGVCVRTEAGGEVGYEETLDCLTHLAYDRA